MAAARGFCHQLLIFGEVALCDHRLVGTSCPGPFVLMICSWLELKQHCEEPFVHLEHFEVGHPAVGGIGVRR